VIGKSDPAGFVHDEDVDERSGIGDGLSRPGPRHASVVDEDRNPASRFAAEGGRRSRAGAGQMHGDHGYPKLASREGCLELPRLIGAEIAEVGEPDDDFAPEPLLRSTEHPRIVR
jgi:hypothetical protein